MKSASFPDRSSADGRLLAGALTLALTAAGGVQAAESDDAITVYSSLQPGAVSPELYRPASGRHPAGQVPGYAIVRHDRSYDLREGIHPLRVTDVAALIDPTTVSFSSLDQPSTRVLEQSFQFDLVSQAKLFDRFVGERIVIEQIIGDHVRETEGVLLSASDGLTLQLDDGSVQAVRSFGNIRFPDLPGGLITRPTLEWLLDSPADGSQETRIAYETRGMTWWADYNLVYSEGTGGKNGGCELDLSSWVSIINQSGAGFENARLKLIAGDVHRAEPGGARREIVARMAMADEASAGFQEKSFFEYHLYTLGRRTDLPDNATKQIELFPAVNGVSCEKELVFAPTLDYRHYGGLLLDRGYGRFGNGDVNVYLRFGNEESEGLGVPLPAGRIRVNQLDPADGSLEFIGEDVIDHTPRGEEVLIEMGEAFDVVGERQQSDFRVDTNSRQLWETIEIRLRNRKEEPVSVVVLENLYRMANWEIEDASHRHEKVSGNRIRFEVSLDPDEEAVLRYTAHYSW